MTAYPGAKIVDNDTAKKTAVTLENLIQKYGIEQGTAKWESYKKKQAYSNSFEYKQNKYGWSRDQFDHYNLSRAVTLENMITKYGESQGIQKWQDYCDRQAYTNTKQYFIEKYGEVLGLEKYKNINKAKATNNAHHLAEKLNISIDDAVEIILNRQQNIFSSNLELEFVEQLEKIIGPLEFSNKTKPFGKWSAYLDTYVVFDIKHKNCIIEFNGDYWHANPLLYVDTAVIRNKTAKDIWQKDFLKLKTAQDLGFQTLVIWESEFKKDKWQTVQKTAQWISNVQQSNL